MAAYELDERARFSIVLALTAGSGDRTLLGQQDAQGRGLGLTRAEIDAARRGFSFDYRTARAMALALAHEEGMRQDRRRQAIRAGIDRVACAEIEQMAAKLLPAPSAKGLQNHG